jgi:hypothetical protein
MFQSFQKQFVSHEITNKEKPPRPLLGAHMSIAGGVENLCSWVRR